MNVDVLPPASTSAFHWFSLEMILILVLATAPLDVPAANRLERPVQTGVTMTMVMAAQPVASATAADIAAGQPIIVRPTSENGAYYPAVIIRAQGEGYFVRFIREAPPPDCKRVQVSYRDSNQAFVACEGRMALVQRTQGHTLACLILTTGPTAAEQRNNFRVSLTAQDVPGTVGHGIKCRIVDISPTGVGLVVCDPMATDFVVDVRFEFEGQTIAGQARVCNQRRQADGQYRCGLESSHAGLTRQLCEATMAAQRQQLRRMARITP